MKFVFMTSAARVQALRYLLDVDESGSGILI
jgi:hypothetical protein